MSQRVRSVMRCLGLGAAGLLAAGISTAAPVACRQPAPRAVLERVFSAACDACWREAGTAAPRGTLVLDWIAPAADDAPMAVAALPEALSRAAPRIDATTERRSVLPRRPPVSVRVADGPAWNGYVGLQVTLTRTGTHLPGSVAYMALVERVPAGSEGTAIDRQLVRVLIGPLPLDELATLRTVRHLRSVRLPEGAQPERLASIAWLESADGRMLAAAQSAAAGCVGKR